MKVLCDVDGRPVKVGDRLCVRVDEDTEIAVRMMVLPESPGNWPTIAGGDLIGNMRVDPAKLGLHWEDRPDPAPAELTVRDEYVLALLPLMLDSHLTNWEDRINNAFRLADYCMEKRK